VAVAVANQDRGLPYAALLVGALFLVWTYVLNRTRFGRHIYAVGGKAEAARSRRCTRRRGRASRILRISRPDLPAS
jgi:D-xylose transport system permease protein